MGLASLGTHDEAAYTELKELLYTDSAVAGEAAGIAMGLVQVGNAGKAGGGEAVAELLAYAKDTSHEKIIRGVAVGVALMNYGREEAADGVIEQLKRERDPILRYGAMYTIGLAYCGTGAAKAVKALLHVAVSDVSNDVRMAAIISLAFVLFKVPEKLPELVKLLLVSFNPHVRYASCMAVGIVFAGTGDKAAIEILEPMLEDLTDFVRQGALIGTSMICMEQSDANKTVKKFREKLVSMTSDKHQAPLTKMGAIMGQGIIDAGGRNVSLSMQSRDGFTRVTSVVGIALFCQYWYWHPLMHCLNLAFTPSLVAGLNKDLDFVKSYEITCAAKPSAFAYPKRLEEKKEVEKKKIATVTLSTTAKSKAREARKKKAEGGDDAMEVETVTEGEAKKEGGVEAKADANADADADADKPVEATTKKTKKVPEPLFFNVPNPSRLTLAQAKHCSAPTTQRYRPVIPGSCTGIILLSDSTPEVEVNDDDIEKVKAPSVEEEEVPMPEPFLWVAEPAPAAVEPKEEVVTSVGPG